MGGVLSRISLQHFRPDNTPPTEELQRAGCRECQFLHSKSSIECLFYCSVGDARARKKQGHSFWDVWPPLKWSPHWIIMYGSPSGLFSDWAGKPSNLFLHSDPSMSTKMMLKVKKVALKKGGKYIGGANVALLLKKIEFSWIAWKLWKGVVNLVLLCLWVPFAEGSFLPSPPHPTKSPQRRWPKLSEEGGANKSSRNSLFKQLLESRSSRSSCCCKSRLQLSRPPCCWAFKQ